MLIIIHSLSKPLLQKSGAKVLKIIDNYTFNSKLFPYKGCTSWRNQSFTSPSRCLESFSSQSLW